MLKVSYLIILSVMVIYILFPKREILRRYSRKKVPIKKGEGEKPKTPRPKPEPRPKK